MNANRTLGLLAAILVTAAQATVLAVDTRSASAGEAASVHFDASLRNSNNVDARLAYSGSHGQVGG